MNKWDLNNPFVSIPLQKALLGYYSINGRLLEPSTISLLENYFSFLPTATYVNGISTLIPFPDSFLKAILTEEFLYLDITKVNELLLLHGLDPNLVSESYKTVISLTGRELLYYSHLFNQLNKFFVPNFIEALKANKTNGINSKH